LTEKYKKLYPV